MNIDLLLEVELATVADLDRVTVEDFVEHMIFRELFVGDFKERSSNVGSHALTTIKFKFREHMCLSHQRAF